MDESGIHDGAHVCVIAGYWGSIKKWVRFEKRWSEILKAANEPTLLEFKSTEFWHSNGGRKGVFANWSDRKANMFITALADCIVEAKLIPADATLVVEEWEKLNSDERRFLTGVACIRKRVNGYYLEHQIEPIFYRFNLWLRMRHSPARPAFMFTTPSTSTNNSESTHWICSRY